MKYHALPVIALCALLVSCERKKPSESTASVESTAVAEARTDEDMLKSEIGRGLEEKFNNTQIPLGEVEIVDRFSPLIDNDWNNRRFRSDFFDYLKYLESKQLVTLAEKQQSDVNAIERMGARTVNVMPTERARKVSDPKLSNDKLLTIRYATCKVLKIIRSSPYQSLLLPQSEEYRLVLGTYRRTPNEIRRELEPNDKEIPELKFRAILKLNPFTKRYVFVTADWGKPEEDQWETQNVQ